MAIWFSASDVSLLPGNIRFIIYLNGFLDLDRSSTRSIGGGNGPMKFNDSASRIPRTCAERDELNEINKNNNFKNKISFLTKFLFFLPRNFCRRCNRFI